MQDTRGIPFYLATSNFTGVFTLRDSYGYLGYTNATQKGVPGYTNWGGPHNDCIITGRWFFTSSLILTSTTHAIWQTVTQSIGISADGNPIIRNASDNVPAQLSVQYPAPNNAYSWLLAAAGVPHGASVASNTATTGTLLPGYVVTNYTVVAKCACPGHNAYPGATSSIPVSVIAPTVAIVQQQVVVPTNWASSNLVFSVAYNPPYSATNVWWSLSPSNISGGATFNGPYHGTNVLIQPGSIATSYVLTARAYYYTNTPTLIYTSTCDTAMLYVVGIVKIPLGGSATLSPGAVGKVFLPSMYGGSNTLSGANVKLYFTDGSDLDAAKALQLNDGMLESYVIAQGSPCIYQVPANMFGWFYVKSTEPSSVLVTSDFWEIGVASNKPWNGWYWPTSTNCPPNMYGTNGPLNKYDQVYGTNSQARAWEAAYHSGGSNWEGHCWGWSVASILVSSPAARTSTNGVAFTEDDMRGLYTEVADCLAFCEIDPSVRLTGLPAVVPTPFLGDVADAYCERFHVVMRNILLNAHKPVQSNLRDSTGTYSNEVWNHAIWKYEAQLREAPGGDERVIRIKNWTYANYDGNPPPCDSTSYRQDYYCYEVRFAGGEIENGYSNRNWIASGPVGGDQRFIPQTLLLVLDSEWTSTNTFVTKTQVDGL